MLHDSKKVNAFLFINGQKALYQVEQKLKSDTEKGVNFKIMFRKKVFA